MDRLSISLAPLAAILMATLGVACGDGNDPGRPNKCTDSDADGVPAYTADCTATAYDCNDNDRDTKPGATEACDGVDNDCDDDVDEGCACVHGETRSCGIDVGACQAGTETCTSGVWGRCENGIGPAYEVCDGADNDCDGETDEDLVTPGCSLQVGVCVGSRKACGGSAGWTPCGAPEYGANYVANEDGAADGTVCDGRDNDCDGTTDEGCACNAGESVLCGSDVGECSRGLQTCTNGQFGPCVGSTEPTDEICDGLDNDCDDSTDEPEDLVVPDCPDQEGVCAGAKPTCNGAAGWSECGAAEYGANWMADETPAGGGCDTLDNDCDTIVDEGCSCVDGATQPCGSEIGECQQGTQVCANGFFGDCRGAVGPVDEICDGLDNDCDDSADDNLTPPNCPLQDGVCAGSAKVCGGASGWQDCAGTASYSALYREEEDPGIDPGVCDGFDNDCDGQVDENCDCTNDDTQVCGTNIGECSQGTQTCAGGRWGTCEGEIPAVNEICDGLDNDCDAAVDEDLQAPNCALTAGVCAGAKQRCAGAGGFIACEPADYGPLYELDETSCDTHDNDCDMQVDEGCACVDGTMQNCGSDVGVCEHGTQTCAAGAWGPCTGVVLGSLEVCNGADDDCDGNTDELDDLTPPDCDRYLGVCAGAVKACGGFVGWLACEGTVSYGPSYAPIEDDSLCDGLDNDCDGETDEFCTCIDGDTQPCGSNTGACVSGVQTCAAGAWGVCVGAVGPVGETCDGVDNDCDASTDEDLVVPCALQLGVCAGAVSSCTDGTYPTCGAAEYGMSYEPTEISCDGLDNNCDGRVDETCGRPPVVINEILYDEIGIDTGLSMFIELYAPPGTWLGGLSLRAVNGANGQVYKNVDLPNVQVPFNGYFLIADLGASALLNDIANLLADVDLQNSPDNLELVFNAGTPIEDVIDALGYGAFTTDDVFLGEGSPAPDAAPGESITRDDVHTDSGDNSADFVVSSSSTLGVPTPGGASIPRIHVNLAWDTDATDFDLHLLRGGAVWGTAPGDCFFANRTPDWGVADDPSDDPRLNRDDQDGFGPEFIDLVLPPTGDNYLIEVQAWANTATTVATVTIALEGGGYPDVNELTFQQTISASDIYWAVARINVDATGHLTVDPLDTTSTSQYDN